MNSTQQRKAGVVLSYISQFIHILTGMVYTPVMLRLLGQSEYGLYQLVYSVVSYLSLLSLGFSASYMRFYARAKASEEKDAVNRLNGMFLTIFLAIASICLLCGTVMVMNVRSIFADGLSEAEYSTAKTLMSLMVFNLALSFPSSVFSSITTAHEKFVFQKVIEVVQSLLNPFLTLPLLIMGYGSVSMVCVSTLLTISKLVISVYYCFHKLHAGFVFSGFKFGILKEMWVFTFFIFINQIIDQINWNVDKFLLGRFAGTTAVAIYGLGGTLNTMYMQFSTSVSNVFVPKVNKIVATSNDDDLLTQIFTKVGRIQFVIISLIMTGFIFFGKPFMTFWGGEGYESSYYVALWLIIPVTVPLIQNLGIEIQRAKNMHKMRSIVYLVISVANVLISIPLIKYFGAVGASAGTAISLFVGNIVFMNFYYHKKIGLNVLYFWKNILSFIPALIIPAMIGTAIDVFIPIKSILTLGVLILIYTGVFCMSMYFIGMNKEEKNLIRVPLRKILGR